MDDIWLEGTAWRTRDDFYDAYLKAVGAPDWHGRNLDALWDSLMGGDISERNPPLRIHISGIAQMGAGARQMARQFRELASEAQSQGRAIEVDLE